MKFKYNEKWNNGDSYHQPYAQIGDEKKTFVLENGIAGFVKVYESTGGWNWLVSINDEVVRSNPSWGERTKTKAKSMAVNRLRQWANSQGVNE